MAATGRARSTRAKPKPEEAPETQDPEGAEAPAEEAPAATAEAAQAAEGEAEVTDAADSPDADENVGEGEESAPGDDADDGEPEPDADAPELVDVGDIVLYNRATHDDDWLPLLVTHVRDADTVDGIVFSARPRAAGFDHERPYAIRLDCQRGTEYGNWQPK